MKNVANVEMLPMANSNVANGNWTLELATLATLATLAHSQIERL